MLKKLFILIFISFTYLNAQTKEPLIFYVGITMIKPMQELSKEFEKTNNCEIKILQGGSQELYDSIKLSKIGDLYLPGSDSYIKKHANENIFLDSVFVGYNKLALIVKKGNPKNIKNSLDELTNPTLKVVLGNAESGSVGNATKKVLTLYGNYKEAILNTIFLAPDSRNLIQSIKENKADLILNWHATIFWDENKDMVEALEIDEKYTNRSKLVLTLLNTSKNKPLAKKFLELASSAKGKATFRKYGF